MNKPLVLRLASYLANKIKPVLIGLCYTICLPQYLLKPIKLKYFNNYFEGFTQLLCHILFYTIYLSFYLNLHFIYLLHSYYNSIQQMIISFIMIHTLTTIIYKIMDMRFFIWKDNPYYLLCIIYVLAYLTCSINYILSFGGYKDYKVIFDNLYKDHQILSVIIVDIFRFALMPILYCSLLCHLINPFSITRAYYKVKNEGISDVEFWAISLFAIVFDFFLLIIYLFNSIFLFSFLENNYAMFINLYNYSDEELNVRYILHNYNPSFPKKYFYIMQEVCINPFMNNMKYIESLIEYSFYMLKTIIEKLLTNSFISKIIKNAYKLFQDIFRTGYTILEIMYEALMLNMKSLIKKIMKFLYLEKLYILLESIITKLFTYISNLFSKSWEILFNLVLKFWNYFVSKITIIFSKIWDLLSELSLDFIKEKIIFVLKKIYQIIKRVIEIIIDAINYTWGKFASLIKIMCTYFKNFISFFYDIMNIFWIFLKKSSIIELIKYILNINYFAFFLKAMLIAIDSLVFVLGYICFLCNIVLNYSVVKETFLQDSNPKYYIAKKERTFVFFNCCIFYQKIYDWFAAVLSFSQLFSLHFYLTPKSIRCQPVSLSLILGEKVDFNSVSFSKRCINFRSIIIIENITNCLYTIGYLIMLPLIFDPLIGFRYFDIFRISFNNEKCNLNREINHKIIDLFTEILEDLYNFTFALIFFFASPFFLLSCMLMCYRLQKQFLFERTMTNSERKRKVDEIFMKFKKVLSWDIIAIFIFLHLKISFSFDFWKKFISGISKYKEYNEDIDIYVQNIFAEIVKDAWREFCADCLLVPFGILTIIFSPWKSRFVVQIFIDEDIDQTIEHKLYLLLTVWEDLLYNIFHIILTCLLLISLLYSAQTLFLVIRTIRYYYSSEESYQIYYMKLYKKGYQHSIQKLAYKILSLILLTTLFLINVMLISRIFHVFRRIKHLLLRELEYDFPFLWKIFNFSKKSNFNVALLNQNCLTSILSYCQSYEIFKFSSANSKLHQRIESLELVWKNLYYNYYHKKYQTALKSDKEPVGNFKKKCIDLHKFVKEKYIISESERDTYIGITNVFLEELIDSVSNIPHLILFPLNLLMSPIVFTRNFIFHRIKIFISSSFYVSVIMPNLLICTWLPLDYYTLLMNEGQDFIFKTSAITAIASILEIILLLIISLLNFLYSFMNILRFIWRSISLKLIMFPQLEIFKVISKMNFVQNSILGSIFINCISILFMIFPFSFFVLYTWDVPSLLSVGIYEIVNLYHLITAIS
jgi:hypothetical protein